MNICEKKQVRYEEEALSAQRSCDPLDFMLALGKTISINIDSLKEAKNAIESGVQKRKNGGAVTNCDCDKFITFSQKSNYGYFL